MNTTNNNVFRPFWCALTVHSVISSILKVSQTICSLIIIRWLYFIQSVNHASVAMSIWASHTKTLTLTHSNKIFRLQRNGVLFVWKHFNVLASPRKTNCTPRKCRNTFQQKGLWNFWYFIIIIRVKTAVIISFSAPLTIVHYTISRELPREWWAKKPNAMEILLVFIVDVVVLLISCW